MIAHAKTHAPLEVYATTVAGDWIDYNGHMNDAAYALVFSRSVDALMDRIGLDAAARKRTGQSLFTVKMMLHYFREAREGEALTVDCRLIEHDDKRIRVWLEMFDAGGERLAASEQLLLSVALTADGAARRGVDPRNQGGARRPAETACEPAAAGGSGGGRGDDAAAVGPGPVGRRPR